MIGAELDEPANGAVAAPVDLARRAFHMVPQDIAGDDGDARRLHLEQFLLPIAGGEAGEVEFAHDRQPGPAIASEIAVGEAERAMRAGAAAHVEMAGFERQAGLARVEGERGLRGGVAGKGCAQRSEAGGGERAAPVDFGHRSSPDRVGGLVPLLLLLLLGTVRTELVEVPFLF